MRHGLVGISALVLGSMMTGGCSSSGDNGGAGGSPSNGGAGGQGVGGGGGAATSFTTLSSSKAVNALTPTEVTQLCNDTYAYFGSAIPKATTCKWKGLSYAASSSAPTQAQLQQGCTNKETACQPTDPWADNLGCNDIPTTCTATVAQYTACISAEVAAFIQTVNGLASCATLTDTAPVFDAQTSAPPPSCVSLNDVCPDLYPPSPLSQ
jgi:hypothetical protein